MQFRYLPMKVSHDAATHTWCAEGEDVHGQLFGVGAGSSPQAAATALRAYILESLLGAASDGDDLTSDLPELKPEGECLAFSPHELLPVRLRCQRARQQLRQADVAERLGLTQQAYRKLETPGANPTLATILRLEQALGVTLLRWG